VNWLDDTVALVTGAGSGIGKAVTRRFVAEGARVVAFDISDQRLNALQREFGDRVTTVCGDVRTPADNRKAVDGAIAAFGKLDVFVGNAGLWDGKCRLTDLADDQLIAGFDEVFATNVKGYLLGAKAASAELARNKGCIIFTLSTSSFYVGGGGPIYVAAKHATLGVMRALAHELAPDIRVNGVAPSGTVTAMADAPSLAKPAKSDSAGNQPGRRKRNILGLTIQADDHVGAYVLLASRFSGAITGTVINSDGGRGVA
jgi:NAD(P)-dependent dehydrogenase (short-subunit alcohol dehydrogenase family)